MRTSSTARLRAAAPVTFTVYVCQALLALAPAWPLSRAIERTLATHPLGLAALSESGGLWRLETIASLGDAWSLLGDVTVIALLLTLALAPLLQMTWLSALLRGLPLRDALALGVRRYAAAIGISVALLPILTLALATLALVPSLSLLLNDTPAERTRDVVALVSLLPGLLMLAMWGVWHDLARASLARSGHPISAVVRAALAAVHPTALPAYLLWLGVGATLTLLAQFTGSWLDGSTPMAAIATITVTQGLALARTFVRAQWLTVALDRVR